MRSWAFEAESGSERQSASQLLEASWQLRCHGLSDGSLGLGTPVEELTRGSSGSLLMLGGPVDEQVEWHGLRSVGKSVDWE